MSEMNTEAARMPMASLVEAVGQPPEGIDTATMLIAGTDPNVLASAAHTVNVDDFIHEQSAEGGLRRARAYHDNVMRTSIDQAERTRALEQLQQAARSHQDIQVSRASIAGDVALAREIQQRQQQLSRPLRWLAGLTTGLIFGSGTAVLMYDAMHNGTHEAVANFRDYNATAPKGYELKVPDDKLSTGDYAILASAGGGVALLLGQTGVLVSTAYTGRFARSRARRQVRRATR